MVIFNFKLMERGEVCFHLSSPERLDVVLRKYAGAEGVNLGSYIAVRDGKVVSGKTLVSDGDMVDIFPAISGG